MKILKRTEFRIFFALGLLFLVFMSWVGWNESSRIALTESIVTEKSFKITEYAEMTGDRAQYEDNYYSEKMPGLSIMSVPFRLFAGLFFSEEGGEEVFFGTFSHREKLPPAMLFGALLSTFFLSGVPTLLTGWLLYLLSADFIDEQRKRILVPIIFCLGTIALSGALHLQGHALATFFAFASFFVFYKKKEFKHGDFTAGILAGIAFTVEIMAIIPFFAVSLVYLFEQKKEPIFKYFLGFLIIFSLILVYNAYNFGNPLEFGYLNLDWESQHVTDQISTQYFNAKMDADLSVQDLSSIMSDKKIGFSLLFHPTFYLYRFFAILRALFSVERGLLVFSPILLLSLLFIFKLKKRLLIPVLSTFLLSLWFISTPYFKWWGGASFGSRYLLITVPFLMIPLINVLPAIKLRIIYPLLFLSITISVFGSLQPPLNIDPEPVLVDFEYVKTLKSFETFDNHLIRYGENFYENKFSIPLVSNSLSGKPFDTRIFNNHKRESATVAHFNSGVLVVDFDKLSVVLFVVIISLIFLPTIKKNKILSFIFFTALITTPFQINDYHPVEGWYEEGSGYLMKDKGLIFFSARNDQDILEVDFKNHFSENIDIYLNGRIIFSGKTEDGRRLIESAKVKEGKNKLELKSDSCLIPATVESVIDTRCISIELLSFNIHNKKDHPFGSSEMERASISFNNFFRPEYRELDYGFWLKKKGKIKTSEEDARLSVKIISYHQVRELILVYGKNEEKITVFPDRWTEISLPTGEEIDFFAECDTPASVTGEEDSRCLSVFIVFDLIPD